MTDKYLIFPTEKEALDRSAKAWVDVLGREPNPEDVTRYLWTVLVNPKDGTAVLVIPDAPEKAAVEITPVAYDALSTPNEKTDAVDELPADYKPAPMIGAEVAVEA